MKQRFAAGNVQALLAENEALRQEVWSLRQQLELLRGRASSRFTTGAAPTLTLERVEGWCQAMARHPAWAGLRVGPPGGLRGLVEDLRRHRWDPSLTLEEELDHQSPGLGAELGAALRGPHSRGRWAVRAAFTPYGPRAGEWLREAPERVVVELHQRLEGQRGQGNERRRGTRTANHSQTPSETHNKEPSGQHSSGFSTSGAQTRKSGASHPGSGEKAPGSGATSSGPKADASGSGAGSPGARRKQAAEGAAEPASKPTLDPRQRAALRVLGLDSDASPRAIKRGDWRLAKAHHPNLGGDPGAFHRLEAAYRVLVG